MNYFRPCQCWSSNWLLYYYFSAVFLQEICPERTIKTRTYLKNIQYSLKSLEYSYDKMIFYLEHPSTEFNWIEINTHVRSYLIDWSTDLIYKNLVLNQRPKWRFIRPCEHHPASMYYNYIYFELFIFQCYQQSKITPLQSETVLICHIRKLCRFYVDILHFFFFILKRNFWNSRILDHSRS